MPKPLSAKMESFCLEYLVDLNATQAAIRAGYSKNNARQKGYSLLQDERILNRITEARADIKNSKIADIEEIEEFLTACIRGEAKEEVVQVVKNSDGSTRTQKQQKIISTSDRIKAAELMVKRIGGFTENVKISGELNNPIKDLTTEELRKIINK